MQFKNKEVSVIMKPKFFYQKKNKPDNLKQMGISGAVTGVNNKNYASHTWLRLSPEAPEDATITQVKCDYIP